MNTTQHESPAADVAAINKSVGVQVKVGVALMLITSLGVAVSFIPFHSQKARILAVLAFAALNGIIVSGISMHLKTEKKIILKFLVFTVVFLAVLFGITALAYLDSTRLH